MYVTPEVGGLITAPGIRCGMGETLCETEVTLGQTIAVQVETIADEYIFSGWSGACTGDGSCVITIDEKGKFITAVFEATFDETLRGLSEADPRIGGLRGDLTQKRAVQVYLTDYEEATEEDKARILEAINDEYNTEFDTLTLTSAAYTLMQLEEWYDLLFPEIWALSTTVLSDLDEGENRILIGVSTQAAITYTRQLVESLSVPTEAVKVVETFIIDEAQSIIANDEPLNPIVGGAEIRFLKFSEEYGQSPTACTLGFGVHAATLATHRETLATLNVQYDRDTSGFITNSHCTNTQGGVEGTNFEHGNRIGVEIADPEWTLDKCDPNIKNGLNLPCRKSDSALAYATGNTPLEVGLIAKPLQENPVLSGMEITRLQDSSKSVFNLHQIASSGREGYFQISGIDSMDILDREVHKVGRTTGWTRAKVNGFRARIRSTSRHSGRQRNVEWTYYTDKDYIEGGDSGSPVFTVEGEGNRVSLVGINFSSNDESSFFSPIDSIFEELFPNVPLYIRRIQKGNPLVSYDVEWLGENLRVGDTIERELRFSGETDKFLFKGNGISFESAGGLGYIIPVLVLGYIPVLVTESVWSDCITPGEKK